MRSKILDICERFRVDNNTKKSNMPIPPHGYRVKESDDVNFVCDDLARFLNKKEIFYCIR